jgi:hypothetical protein
MYYAPEYDEEMEEDLAIDAIMMRDYPPPVPTYMDYIRGFFWLSPLGFWFAPRQARIMRKVHEKHMALCKEGKREGSASKE